MAATFAETPLIRSKHRQEAIVRVVLGLMAVAMVLPLLAIIGYLVVEAWPLPLSTTGIGAPPSRILPKANSVWASAFSTGTA